MEHNKELFTPGPWTIEELSGGHNWSLIDPETNVILGVVGDRPASKRAGFLSGNQILANATLISCAPDLLKALQDLVNAAESSHLDTPAYINLLSRKTIAAKEVIIKAGGIL
jgi:hypothetical protein